MFGIGVQELAIILVVALLVFGPKRLPELARMLGRGMGEFRRASSDLRQSLALDDLQNDLRRDLNAAGTIHRSEKRSDTRPQPGTPPLDRPAQAGDDLEPVGSPAAQAASTSPTTHPGELPLGNDHEHRSSRDDEGLDEGGSETGDEPASSARPGPATAPRSDATDSERG